MNVMKRSWSGICLSATSAWLGCAAEPGPTPSETELEVHSEALIGGFAANTRQLDAIGSLVVLLENAPPGESPVGVLCTGSLVDENTVVTAKHCADIVGLVPDDPAFQVAFALGPNALAPTRVIPVIEAVGLPGRAGGFTQIGRDVAVLQLAEAVTDVAPVAVAGLGDTPVGTKFIGIGYGRQGNSFTLPTRRLGKLTLRAREGRTWELLLGSFEAFFKHVTDRPVPTDCDTPEPADVEACFALDDLRDVYENTRLEATDEILVGAAPGDAQPCFGDSGGPLLRLSPEGRYVSYGVVNGGIGSTALVCDYGAVYASFGSQALEFIAQEKAWVDPCGDLSTTGVCEGTMARRCTKRGEGRRRVVEVDCSELGLSCETQGDGSVGCGSDDATAAELPPAVEPSPPEVLEPESLIFVGPSAFDYLR